VARGILGNYFRRPGAEMHFFDHLEELRRVILASLGALLICSAIAYVFSGRVVDYVIAKTVGHAQFIGPLDAWNARMMMSVLLGAVVSLPFVSFQIWGFVLPGLHRRERRVVVPVVISSTLLFLVGMAFNWFFLTPQMLRLLAAFGTEHLRANLAVGPLLDFVLKMSLGTGLMFQLPLVILAFTSLGILKPSQVWSKWRHAVIVILILAAAVTPGDSPSTLVMAAPIIILYFASAIIASVVERVRRRPAPDGAGTDGLTGG
jgi:sec-independent protein translocase protein TatC